LVAGGVLLPAPNAGAQELVNIEITVCRVLECERNADVTTLRYAFETVGIVNRTVEPQMTAP
jgi:hypothetical protein